MGRLLPQHTDAAACYDPARTTLRRVFALNLALGISSVVTKADVELKVVTPLLTNPNYLSIPTASIQGKTYLAPTVLDKKAGKTGGYYPDFSVWELGFAVLIVEAKRAGHPGRGGLPGSLSVRPPSEC